MLFYLFNPYLLPQLQTYFILKMWMDNNTNQNERERERKNCNMLAQDSHSVNWRSDILLSEEKNRDELKKRTKDELQQKKVCM